MSAVRLIFALHNHQPVGNFHGVFEAAYREAYEPFLDVLEDYPEVGFVLHLSGPLLEWLLDHRPAYIDRVRRLVQDGRIELLGGPLQEPILPNIPHRDRVGQIRAHAALIRDVFGVAPRGIWLPERVWEQGLVSALGEAGVEYTALDDFHFLNAGLPEDALLGYYLTEDEGRLLKVFPNSEALRYLIPWKEPHDAYLHLRRLAEERPGSVIVCADDGEKFGSWPQTFDHVYTRGWLRHFCDMLRANGEWIRATTFARAVDETLPLGKVYLPDSSYREMTEWVLTPARHAMYRAARDSIARGPDAARLGPVVRPGGFWRNFKARYTESDEMYCRMLTVSRRLARLEEGGSADPARLASARAELYRGQCNCPYWHGAFGGLYLPHLRNAIYGHLIAADGEMDRAEGRPESWADAQIDDFNLDARQEVRLENDRLIGFIRPAQGGHLYELDSRRGRVNLLATLERRPETYHETIRAVLGGTNGTADAPPSVTGEVVFKQANLDRLLVYDNHPRKAFVDHFIGSDTTLGQWIAGEVRPRGDFVRGAYLGQVVREEGPVRVDLERRGFVDAHAVRVVKSYRLEPGSTRLEVAYRIEGFPRGLDVEFAVELNVAALAGHAPDRFYRDVEGANLGPLDSRLDLSPRRRIDLCDEWLDLAVGLDWSRPAAVWCFPIETVSQSEGGFEGVYQSSVVIPRWRVEPDEDGRWEVRLGWTLGRVDDARTAVAESGTLASEPLVGSLAMTR